MLGKSSIDELRPSSFILFKSLPPRCLGSLLYLFGRKIFVECVLWNTGSFDQWGVELGKVAADKIILDMSVNGHSVDTYVP